MPKMHSQPMVVSLAQAAFSKWILKGKKGGKEQLEAGKYLSYKIRAVLLFPLGMEIVIKLLSSSLSGFWFKPCRPL